ncbi:MAG: GDSL-type esterase/lipase family protein [Bacteroidales bacterium]|jgi:lysophospholipase L1-like esterase|nr:GDSL-type esterase/lipase family protein [Bacteroidales bacterium]
MRPYKIFIFILLTFFVLGLLGIVFPENGITTGSTTLTFPPPNDLFSLSENNQIDIEKKLEDLKKQTALSEIESMRDSLSFFREFVNTNIARFHFPNNDYLYLDNFFARLEKAKSSSKTLHILHYGDSQIEMDRISGVVRQRLQNEFGGEGAGIVPAIQTIPSFSVRQFYSGVLSRYVVYGDTSQPRASHRRYGLLANVSQLNGSATITVAGSNSKKAQEGTKQFSRLVLIVGNNAGNFSATCQSRPYSIKENKKTVSVITWDFDAPVSRATIELKGKTEIYGVSMEGKSGVTVDNVPLRGSSGTIFTRIDSLTLSQCYQQMNIGMIILQFGGNMMPQINSQKAINRYMGLIARQIQYLHRLNPNAVILFIGPSDMSKRINGKLQTYPYLPALNNALRETVNHNNAAYWDMFNVMGGENSMLSWVKHSPQWAGSDYIHFTEAGANQIATLLSNAFMLHYKFYVTRKKCDPALIEQFMGKK